MGDDQQLKIVITAQDDASATLKQMAANTEEATNHVATSSQRAGWSFSTIAEHVIEAVSVYELYAKAQEAVKAVIEGSVEAAMQESATMVQVAVDVKNAGLSYAELAPQIADAAAQNMRLGFTQNDTQLSLGKAILATGNYNDALKLNHLAMDLSVAKGIDLNSATVLLQQAMAGNTRVLKQYGISLDSSATSAEVLNTIQGKVGGSADALAGTPLGHMRQVQAEWEHIQVTIGEQLMPIVEQLFKLFEDNLPVIEKSVSMISGALDVISGAANIAAAPFRILGNGIGNVMNAAQGLQLTQLSLSEAFGISGTKASGASSATAALSKSTADAATNFDNFENIIHGADNAVMKHSDAIAKLGTEYEKMQDSGRTNLSELADSFVSKMQTINDAIAKTKQSIVDLTSKFNASQTDATASVADQIVASEQKIADLKKQIAASTSDSQTKSLREQLATEQTNYDSSLAFRQTHAAEIATAESRAKETDLQRTIDDYNKRQALALAEYNQQLATLNQELVDKQNEATAEEQLFNSKVEQINKIMDAGNVYFAQLSADRLATTTKEVDAEIAQFQALAAVIAQTKSASSSTVSLINVPNLAHHEMGGFVDAPRGTAVPIIAHGGEEIIPAEQSGRRGGTNITVQIIQPQVRRQSDLDDMRAMVDKVMRPLLINAKIAHI